MDYNFIYTVDPTADEPIMLINKHIGMDDELGCGIIGDIFERELLVLDTMNKKRIQVYINSPGGLVKDGYSIYSAILKSITKVDTYCTGMAASIAGVIFQAGRTRYMADYSKLMYHNPYNSDGTIDKGLSPILDSLVTMIASRTGKSEDDIKKIMKKETWIGADEAKENGFCDVVENSGDVNKKRSMSSEPKAFWKESNLILNSLFEPKKQKNMDLTKICNRLDLDESTSIEGVYKAVDRILNKAEEDKKKASEDMEDLKKALKKAEEDKLKAEEDCKNLKSKIDKMEEDKKAKAEEDEKKAEEDKKAKVKNLIEDNIVAGRIVNKEEIIATWTKNAMSDFEGTKSMLESLPLNRIGAKLNTGTINKIDGTSVVASTMANVRAKFEQK